MFIVGGGVVEEEGGLEAGGRERYGAQTEILCRNAAIHYKARSGYVVPSLWTAGQETAEVW